jgi:hypothetical protein
MSKMKLVGTIGKLKKERPDDFETLTLLNNEMDELENQLNELSDDSQTLIPLRVHSMAPRHDVLSGRGACFRVRRVAIVVVVLTLVIRFHENTTSSINGIVERQFE